jgi:GLPGLI family protein
MKKIKLLLLFLLFSCSTKKMSNNTTKKLEVAKFKVEYLYKFKPRKYLLEQNTILYLGENTSLFEYNKGKEPFVMIDGENGQDGYMQDEIGDLIFKNNYENILNIREKIMGKPYITSENTPKIQWILQNESKKIGTFDCKMATTLFRGRKYTAWFTKKIPISDGPWKFQGLPGLILEIYDEKKEYHFSLKSIESINNNTEYVKFNEDGINLKFNDFIKIEEVEFEKMKKLAEAKWDGDGEFKMTKNPTNYIELNYIDK